MLVVDVLKRVGGVYKNLLKFQEKVEFCLSKSEMTEIKGYCGR